MAKETLPKRFYRSAGVEERDGSYVLTLDGRPARTPARALVAVPTRALADALVSEWNAQQERIDPALMPLTRILNSAIDGVSKERKAVADEIVKYAASDLLCYRDGEQESLSRRQGEAWDPILTWAAEELGSRLNHGSGIVFVMQPSASLGAIEQEVAKYNLFELAALHVITTLTGSAILALAVAKGRLEPESAWEAAHIDENYQIERWGKDEEAEARQAARWREMNAAATILATGRD